MLANLRRTSLVCKSFSSKIHRNRGILGTRYFSTINEDHETSTTEEPKETKHFWEIESKKKAIETPKSVKNTTEHVSSATKDFSALLEELFKRTHVPSTPKPSHKDKTDMMIEKKLLDMVTRDRKPYKAKAPLPRSVMAPVYGKNVRSNMHKKDETVLDLLNRDSHWDMDTVTHSESVQLKQREMSSIQAIVESKTDIELLDNVQKEINQDVYPRYYPKVVAKAIEHASHKDPYLALTVFEMVKNKSISSYILGCPAQVYNTLLLLRWNVWGDIYGMLDLMEEMQVNGIEFNNNSRRIVRDVVYEMSEEGSSPFWNPDEKRYCNIMKEMAGKWIITK